MAAEKKIFLDRTDTLQTAVDGMIGAKAARVVLNIPRQSVLGGSIHDFQILKRESETAGKELAIESIDEHVLELAALAKIPARNPIFRTRERTVTDIVPKTKPFSAAEDLPTEENGGSDAEPEERPRRRMFRHSRRKDAPAPAALSDVSPDDEVGDGEDGSDGGESAERPADVGPARKRKRRPRLVVVFASFVAVFGIGYILTTFVLPRVTIDLTLKKTPFDFNEQVTVGTKTADVSASAAGIALPGQLLTAKNSLVMSFQATGSADVTTKASGTLMVYNDYSSAPQVLVATTRFVSPDGKLFRTPERVTIPGAKIVGGVIEPSSLPVHVVAAEPGPSYNVVSSSHWTIPGFQGTPRYEKFYADAPNGMSGGASGTMPVATKEDIAAAQAKAAASLEDSLKSQIGVLSGGRFQILPDAVVFATTSESVTPADASGQFSVLIAGNMSEMVFEANMLQNALIALSGATSTDVKIDTWSASYGSTTLAVDQGQMSFSASGSLVYESKVDVVDLKKEVAGHDEAGLKSVIFGIAGLEKASISFWPFWVSTVPQDQGKIQFNLN